MPVPTLTKIHPESIERLADAIAKRLRPARPAAPQKPLVDELAAAEKIGEKIPEKAPEPKPAVRKRRAKK